MSFTRPFAGFLIAAGTFAAACGSSDVNNRDYGQPPDASQFNPGTGGSDGYGSGAQTAAFVCPDELKACDHVFTYPFSNQSTVELRGDYGGPDTWLTGTTMTHVGDVWQASVHVPYGKPVQYKFIVDGGATWLTDPTAPTVTDSNGNTNNMFKGTTCEPSICSEEGALAPGVFDWRDSTIYFTFVDRFLDGNSGNNCHVNGVSGVPSDYQGGDWAGVTQKINDGYFTDLGINTLWVTVPFDNPNVTGVGQGGDTHQYSGYHGYWPNPAGDNPATLNSESCFGTFAELKGLIAAAHAKGLKVLFDYAMVHVHSGSGLYAAHNNWFWPNDNGHGGNCICGEGCSWDAVPEREHCWFTSYLPHWNYTNQQARDYGVANAVEWIKQTADSNGFGVDGFRADAIKHVDISWLTSVRAKIKSDILATQTPQQRFYMVGETYDFGNRDLIKSYVDPSTKLDGQFDFPLRSQVREQRHHEARVDERPRELHERQRLLLRRERHHEHVHRQPRLAAHHPPRSRQSNLGRQPGRRRQGSLLGQHPRRGRRDGGVRARGQRLRRALHEPRRAARLLR